MALTPFVLLFQSQIAFHRNSALRYGGAIYVESVINASVPAGSTFLANTAGVGGGAIALRSGASLAISDILFMNNSAGKAGG